MNRNRICLKAIWLCRVRIFENLENLSENLEGISVAAASLALNLSGPPPRANK